MIAAKTGWRPGKHLRVLMLLGMLTLLSFCRSLTDAPDRSSEQDQDLTIQESIQVQLDTLYWRFDPLVQETSGLMRIRDTYWTHNDSGGEPELYQFDLTTGRVIRTVRMKGVRNQDWEALAHDSTHFYIGNFGNNFGNRKDLVIYKARIDDLLRLDELPVAAISFTYPDQDRYYFGYNHNHDAEAIIVYQEKIHLFSKNWQDRRCKLYTMPTDPGTYTATFVSEFDAGGTITGADISDDDQTVMLLGYEPGQGFDPFVWKLQGWQGEDLFTGTKMRYEFTIRRQMEGVMFLDDRTLLISAEDEDGQYPSLFRMNL